MGLSGMSNVWLCTASTCMLSLSSVLNSTRCLIECNLFVATGQRMSSGHL